MTQQEAEDRARPISAQYCREIAFELMAVERETEENWTRSTDTRKVMKTGTVKTTPREKDLIRLGAMGLSNHEIAKELGLTEHSVKQYFVRLRLKLGGFHRNMLPGIGLLMGLVSVADVTRKSLKVLMGE